MLSPWILAVVSLTQAAGTSPDWKPYTSAKGKFSVSLPPRPSEKKRVLAISGKTIDLISMSGRKGVATYTAAYADLVGADSDTALKVAQADLVAQSRGELKDEKEITLGESPGKELAIDIPKKIVAGGATETVRIYVVGGRLYELIAVVPLSKADSLADEVTTYFDSFKPTGVVVASTAAAPKPKADAAKAGTSKAAAPKTEKPAPLPANPGGAVLNGLNALNPFAGRGAGGAAGMTPKPAEDAGPLKITAPDGSFTITSPAKMIAQDIEQPPGMPAGAKLNAKIYQVFQGSKIFTLLVMNLPEGAIGHAPDMLAKMRDDTVKSAGGKMIRGNLMNRDGVQGVEFVFTSPAIEPPKGGVASNLVFLDVRSRRMYVLSVTGPIGADEEKDVKEFMSSFHMRGGN